MATNPLIVTFEDLDPVVQYKPSGTALPEQGWATVFPSNIYFEAIGDSRQGYGNSLHITTMAGAALSFEFFGGCDDTNNLHVEIMAVIRNVASALW